MRLSRYLAAILDLCKLGGFPMGVELQQIDTCLHPWYWNFTVYNPGIGTLSYTISSPLGRIQHIFCSKCHSQFTIFPTRYPLLLGGQRQYRMRSLPNTSTHDQQWESNPIPSGLNPNDLSIWPHAPICMLFIFNVIFYPE